MQLNGKLLPLLLGFLLTQKKIKPRMATAARTTDNNNKEIIGVPVKVNANIKRTADTEATKIMKIAKRSIEIEQMIIPNVATCIIHVFRKKPRPTSGHH